jgi:hypothetical protein
MDDRLRQLERAAQTGDIDAEVRWLNLRRRHGLIDSRRLQLLAFMGHRAARKLLPDQIEFEVVPQHSDDKHSNWREWKKILRTIGKHPAIVASHAAILCVPESYYRTYSGAYWDGRNSERPTQEPKQLLEAISAYIDNPSEETKTAVRKIRSNLTDEFGTEDWGWRRIALERHRFWEAMFDLLFGRYNSNFWAKSAQCMQAVKFRYGHGASVEVNAAVDDAVKQAVIAWAIK